MYVERMKKGMTNLAPKITTAKGRLRLWDDIIVFKKNMSQHAAILNSQVELGSLDETYSQLFGAPATQNKTQSSQPVEKQ